MNHPGGLREGTIQFETALAVDHVPRTGPQIAQIVSEQMKRPVSRSSVASALTRLSAWGCVVRLGGGLWVEPDDFLKEPEPCRD